MLVPQIPRAESSNPGHISDDHENADGGHSRQRKGHAQLHENSNKGHAPFMPAA
jgi:hypothetical protein